MVVGVRRQGDEQTGLGEHQGVRKVDVSRGGDLRGLQAKPGLDGHPLVRFPGGGRGSLAPLLADGDVGGGQDHRSVVDSQGALRTLDIEVSFEGPLDAEGGALRIAQQSAGDALAGGVGLGEQVLLAAGQEVRGHVLGAHALDRQGFELQLRGQGGLEVDAQLAIGDILAKAQQLQPHRRGQVVVLVVLVVLHVGDGVDAELAAPERGLIGRGGVEGEAAGPRPELRMDQHVSVRIGAHPLAVAGPVVDEHVGEDAALERAAVLLAGELQP